MTNCPHCNRTLLSHASVRCNWCGAEIQDSDYLQQAQSERDSYFAHQREHDAISLTRVEAININVNDPWNGAIRYSPSLAKTQRQRMAEAAILRAQTAAQPPAVQPVPFSQSPAFGQEYKSGEPQNAVVEPKPEPEAEVETKPGSRFGHLEF